jgi:hypothetical protein
MDPYSLYCRMIAAITNRKIDPRLWQRTIDHVWRQLSNEEKELARAIPFPTL